jgi:SPOR domain
MADNTYRAFRSRDAMRRGDANAAVRDAPDDPLAELARLIGQSDPQGEYSRDDRRTSETYDDAPPVSGVEWAADESYAEENYQEADSYLPQRPADPFPPLPTAPHFGRHSEYKDEPYAAHPFPAAPRLNGVSEEALSQAIASDGHDRDESYSDERYHDDRYGDRQPHDDLSALMDQPNAEPYRTDGHPDGSDDQQYAEDEYSDEAPSGRRRGGLVMVAAVLGLAVLGTAGAFAYRAMLGGSIMPSLPPIIRAGGGPNKIVPANNPATQSGPLTQAAAGSGSGEKLVSREEQPVDIQDPVKSAPRIVSTIPVVPSVPAPGPVVAAPSAADSAFPPPPSTLAPPATSPLTTGTPMPTSGPSPRKIHTVIVRSDQMGDPTDAAAAAAAAPAPRSSPPATRQVSSARSEPLALVPTAEGAAPKPVRTHTARSEPTTPEPSSPSGGYAVQVTSQRSEAEAKSAFRSLKTKYPAQLGSREPIIRRADLGAKGTYYRALVGPFASMEEAASVCSSLKAAGGNCLVQRN